MLRRRKWQPTPVFLPGESQGQRSLVGCCLWGHTGSDTTEVTEQQQQIMLLLSILKCKKSHLSGQFREKSPFRVSLNSHYSPKLTAGYRTVFSKPVTFLSKTMLQLLLISHVCNRLVHVSSGSSS